ncbi:MAG: tripartite tricarboxylate transporter substrate binding protein [Burkholderiales bacterium]|nr:tripartite tricarboxylate transporter substrate binding protein [Burkholderiales bacterium]
MASKLRVLTAIALACAAGAAPAQDYPNRSIRVIVAQAAGGALDVSSRLITARMSETLGQTLVVENRPSAGGIAGMEAVAKAPPDGYTLLMAAAPIATNTALGIKLPYDPERDFAPISLAVSIPLLFVVHPATPYKTLSDIVADSKRQSGGVAVAIASIGALPHLLSEMMKLKTGANLNLIFYKGSAPASLDTLSGTIPVFIDALGPVRTHVESGKLRAIALSSTVRSPLFPTVPTVGEQGMPDLTGAAFFGLLAPGGTAVAIQRRLNQAIVSALAHPELRDRLLKQGYEIHASTPEGYKAYMKNEIDRWTPVVKAAGIKVD